MTAATIGQRLLLMIWVGSILFVLTGAVWLQQLTAVVFAVFLLQALTAMRRETLLVVALIGTLSMVLLATGADAGGLLQGLQRTLIFAALLPTLQLTRATARRLPAVRDSQRRLTALPERWANIGILLGSQTFGAILNTGAFAIMSAVVDDNAAPARRRSAALASLRGMNIAVLWSPFFVGFAVANTYLPGVRLWQIMPLGLLLVGCGLVIALLMFARPLTFAAITAAFACLRPILLPIGLAATTVIVCSSLTTLSTLATVLLIMPLLCLLQMMRQPATLRAVIYDTYAGMARMGDDLLIIAVAMMLGTVSESSPLILQQIVPLLGDWLAADLVIGVVILLMFGGGLIGLHPMITGTILLVSLGQLSYHISDTALMEAVLIGWALASMTSISSLSVVSAGAMYQVAPLKLAYSYNLLFAVVFGLFTGIVLSLLNGFAG